MTLLDALILGVVEGITEFLPVSSTGHLIITANLLGLDATLEQKRQIDAFNIMIQGGAILAVIGVFRPRFVQIMKGLVARDRIGLRLAINLFIAFLPAAILGVLLNDWIEERLFFAWPVTIALFAGGVVLLLLRKWQRAFFRREEDEVHGIEGEPVSAHSFVDLEHLTWRRALLIGLFQCVAMWPGTSRSMMTIVGGMVVGMRPRHAAEFSFLLGVPTLGGACVYKGFRNFVLDDTNIFNELGVVPVLVGTLVAMVAAALAVKWLIDYLSRHGVSLFGWYRIILAGLLVVLISQGVLSIQPDSERWSEPEMDAIAPSVDD